MELKTEIKMAETGTAETNKSDSSPVSREPLSMSDTHDDNVLDTIAKTEPIASDSQEHGSDNNDSCLDALAMPDVANDEGTSDVVVVPAENTEPVSSDTARFDAGEPSSVVQPRAAEELPLILCSLSIDSLHCIASFLAPTDWSNFGQANHATNRVCNQVFRRVRMHGFRCATEVITAWVSVMMSFMNNSCVSFGLNRLIGLLFIAL